MKHKIDWEEIGEYFIKLWWRIAFIPSILSLIPIVPLAMAFGIFVWFLTGKNTEDYGYNLIEWYNKNIWKKAFP